VAEGAAHSQKSQEICKVLSYDFASQAASSFQTTAQWRRFYHHAFLHDVLWILAGMVDREEILQSTSGVVNACNWVDRSP